ncbi:MAG TPA: hypothetical protein VIO64_01030 [Pseudobacteroides sp.]|uniref:hypothetical protein n=1 Tax=Pseudobacteroides sp. TaxID=1968840 RepID=UPI002F93B815
MLKKIFELILLPEKIYKKFTDRILTLIIGVFALGIIDYIFSISEKLLDAFTGKASADLKLNLFYSLLFIAAYGIADVVFFSVPFFDIVKKLRSDKNAKEDRGSIVKIMKIQITANCIIFIPAMILSYLVYKADAEKNIELLAFLMLLFVGIQIWLAAIVSRGIKSIFIFDQKFKTLIFPIVFFWYYIVGIALNFAMDKLMGWFMH